jgi:hypothetical protein
MAYLLQLQINSKQYFGKTITRSHRYEKSNRILKIKVLMYHRVLAEKPEKKSRWHYVTVTEFRKQMNMIERLGYTPITFSDYQLFIEGKLTLPSKPIIHHL